MAGKRRQKPKQIRPGEPSNGSGQAPVAGPDGDGKAGEMVNLEAFLAEISARLVTAGSVPLPAQQPEQPASQERMQIVVFKLGDVGYAVDAAYVGEVVRSPEITPVPGLPDWVLGVTNLHGDIISVVDLPLFLGARERATRDAAYMIVGQAGDQRIGLVVDDIDIIYTFPIEQLVSPPFKVDPGLVPFMRGAIERQNEFIRFLDCERLLLGPQMQQFS